MRWGEGTVQGKEKCKGTKKCKGIMEGYKEIYRLARFVCLFVSVIVSMQIINEMYVMTYPA